MDCQTIDLTQSLQMSQEEIADLGLPFKCQESLQKAGIHLISDLVSKTEIDLLWSCDVNLKDLEEIQGKLKEYCDANGIPFPWAASSPKETDERKDADRPRSSRQTGMPVWGTWMERISPNVPADEPPQSLGSETNTETGATASEQTPVYSVRTRDTSLDQVSPSNLMANGRQTPERSAESQESNPIVLSDDQSRSPVLALAQGIEVLGLSKRSYNALKRNGIDRVVDLETKTVDDLEGIWGLGRQCIEEIRSKVQQYLETNMISLSMSSMNPTDPHDSSPGSPIVQFEPELPIASETSCLPVNETNNHVSSIPELLELTLSQAVQYPHMTPENWGDFIANSKTTQGIKRSPSDSVLVETRSVAPPDPKFVTSLDVRTLRALKRAGVNDCVSASIVKVRDLVATRQFGKYAATQLFRLLKSELPNLVSPAPSSPGMGPEGTPAKILTLVNSGSPERLQWSRIHKTLGEELQAGRFHSGIEFGGFTLAEWLQVNPEQLNGHDLQRICNTFDFKLAFLTIDDELEEIVNRLKLIQRKVLEARFGKSQQTLQEVAEIFGVTRERIRQINVKAKKVVTKWLSTQSPWRLQTALLLAKDLGEHISLPKWESILVERNLIMRPAKETIFGSHTLEFALVLLSANQTAESPEDTFRIPDNLRSVLQYPGFAADEIKASRALTKKELQEIRRQCRNAGAVSAILLGRKLKTSVSVISKALRIHGYVSLDEEWLTSKPRAGTPISAHYSAFQVNVVKMLSICGPLRVEEIRQGLENHTARFDFAVPPTSVLKELLLQYGFTIGNDDRVLVEKVKCVRIKPSVGERIVLDLIKERGPIITFQELSEEFRRRNRSQPLLSVILRYSVLFRRVDTGLYALRGTRITREDMEAAIARRPVVERDSSLKFSSDGIITWEINLGTYGLGGTIPTGEAAQLAGEWEAITEGTKTGRIKVGEQQIWGLAKAFRRLGVRVGDRIALRFDPEARQVRVLKVKIQEDEED